MAGKSAGQSRGSADDVKKKSKAGKERGGGGGGGGTEGHVEVVVAQLRSTRATLQEVQKTVIALREENDRLINSTRKSEKDTIEVIKYLRREGEKKDQTMNDLRRDLKDREITSAREKEALTEDFTRQIASLDELLDDKMNEVKLMQGELKVVREFRKKRTQMQKELDQIKGAMGEMGRKHKDTVNRMERKFFEEKVRLQKEANVKIAELVTEAHHDAVNSLECKTLDVFQENVRTNEALRLHASENLELERNHKVAKEENTRLREEQLLHRIMMRDKIAQMQQQHSHADALESKVARLEGSLSKVVKEFNAERKRLVGQASQASQQCRDESQGLRRQLEVKNRELDQVKALAWQVLDQRSDVEQFFLDSLKSVKQQIREKQDREHKEAYCEYKAQMRAATFNKGPFPPIRDFRKGKMMRESNIRDLAGSSASVDVADLTWEERECILRALFAKMNGVQQDTLDKTRAALKHTSSNGVSPKALSTASAAGSPGESPMPLPSISDNRDCKAAVATGPVTPGLAPKTVSTTFITQMA